MLMCHLKLMRHPQSDAGSRSRTVSVTPQKGVDSGKFVCIDFNFIIMMNEL